MLVSHIQYIKATQGEIVGEEGCTGHTCDIHTLSTQVKEYMKQKQQHVFFQESF